MSGPRVRDEASRLQRRFVAIGTNGGDPYHQNFEVRVLDLAQDTLHRTGAGLASPSRGGEDGDEPSAPLSSVEVGGGRAVIGFELGDGELGFDCRGDDSESEARQRRYECLAGSIGQRSSFCHAKVCFVRLNAPAIMLSPATERRNEGAIRQLEWVSLRWSRYQPIMRSRRSCT